MTNFFAAYLFLLFGGIGLIMGLIFKKPYLFWCASVAWAITALYFFTQGGTATWVYAVGVFGLLMSMVCVGGAMQAISSNKPVPPQIKIITRREKYTQSLQDLRDRRRGFREK
jgi:hypothetical protein